MNSFFSPDDHSIAPSNTIEMEKYQFLMLKTEMYDLINRLCEHFDLSAEIEFMCMDSFELYLDNLFEQLYREYDQKLNFERNTVDIAIEQTLYIVEKECLLRLVSLISICAKYIDGYRWRATYRLLPDLLCKNGTPYTYKDICRTEYNVFKCLNFTVRVSPGYKTMNYLTRKCSNMFNLKCETFHENAIILLRLAYSRRISIYAMMDEKSNHEQFEWDETMVGAAVAYANTANIRLNRNVKEDILSMISLETNFEKADIFQFSEVILTLFNNSK